MNWQEVCLSPSLRNLPFKIELNEWGKIVMSPASNRHGILQAAIVRALTRAREEGVVISECSILTARSVKVADVAWASAEFMESQGEASPYLKAPELCIEILSPSNTANEMEEKRELYFAKGALEVWLCDEQGTLAFYGCDGRLDGSRLFPGVTRIVTKYLH
ncbi:MAG: Uma2 family endonuclease [Methylococcaceae bacterium]|nr:MAG: Uma2 family endonuclease [Methylococcaceae bacterium]